MESKFLRIINSHTFSNKKQNNTLTLIMIYDVAFFAAYSFALNNNHTLTLPKMYVCLNSYFPRITYTLHEFPGVRYVYALKHID